jgi:adenylate cyclase
VFDMQDRITEGTAAIIEPKIRDAEFQASRRERPDSIAAYDLYLRALHKYDTVKPAENAEAIALLDRAIALDPEYAPALALAAEAREHRLSSGWPLYAEDDVERAIALANAAIERTKDDASVLALSGMVLLQVAHDYDRALAVFDRALAANPRDIDVVFNTGVANILGGDIERAEMLFHRTIKLAQNEGGHIAMTGLGHIEMLRGNYEAALDWLSGSAAVDPNFSPTLWMRIACNAYLGRMDEAARLLVELREKAPGVTIARIMQTQRSRPLERHEVIMRGLRLAGLPDI